MLSFGPPLMTILFNRHHLNFSLLLLYKYHEHDGNISTFDFMDLLPYLAAGIVEHHVVPDRLRHR